ncbi:MAG: 1-deoxy-D-xylulose-5-phosphate reductoisomerase [Parasporobacterium sp.]|nr:1-deoxy-D-xylulose-5-phosphate reductoisomerase [Parasporobacterium sp.]
MKHLTILGSTGSIGTQCLEIVRLHRDVITVEAITGNHNIDLLEEQILEFSPKLVCVYDPLGAEELKKRLEKKGLSSVSVVSGMEGLMEAAAFPASDIVLTAVVGMVGIRPTLEAIRAGKDIALANKETLVCAGSIIMEEIRSRGVKLYPVDSEHSAIFQSLNGEPRGRLSKIILTASGGPFRGYTKEQLKSVTLKDALKHPNWNMGAKVTIDSSTLANKGLEVMEARWLFDVPPSDIQVVIHPQSILHSAVEYEDGAIIGQMGVPDMKLPIQYALFYPDRPFLPGKRVDLFELKSLTFEKPDTDTFKALALAYRAINTGGSMPTVFNAANELAVKSLLEERIEYIEIPEIIEREMNRHKLIEAPTVEEIIAIGEEIMNK